jgi:predicted phosphodiesterase
MKLSVLSDLHLSRGSLPHPRTDADVVVLAGDIARPQQAIAWARELGKPTVYVPGNHEFYGGSLGGTLAELKQLAAGSQVHVLDNEEWAFGNVRFLGSTLWSDFRLLATPQEREASIREGQEKMNDFRRIHVDEARTALFTPDHSAALFDRNVAWLEERLLAPWPGTTVVVTHHAPSARSIVPRFEGSLLNACFASHLDRLLRGDLAAAWIHGHMHDSLDYDAGGTRVVCNPRGYARDGVNENPRFDPDLVIEVA